jgi:hypothetical protein
MICTQWKNIKNWNIDRGRGLGGKKDKGIQLVRRGNQMN